MVTCTICVRSCSNPCSEACFQIQVFLIRGKLFKGLLDFVHWSLSQLLHVEPGKSILHLRCLLTDIHNGHRRNLQKLEEFATIESHVTLGIHAIVQKWNSYRFYSFEEVNFVVQDESVKTAQVMHLENLALKGS